MNYKEMLKRAEEIAYEAHDGVFRKFGKKEPYINHPKRVAEKLLENWYSEKFPIEEDLEFAIVGWLHDVVEDSNWTFDDLRAEGFSEEIIDSLDHLTRRKNEGETYFDFIGRCSEDMVACWVKIEDIIDNSRDLKEGSMKDKYRFAKAFLGMKLDGVTIDYQDWSVS